MKVIVFFLTIILILLIYHKTNQVEVVFSETDPLIISNLLDFHNIERTRLNLKPLELDFALVVYAQKHAEWMAKKNSLKHSDINIANFKLTGENIAWNQQDENEVIEAWMNSTGHRKNILNPKFKNVGFGIAKNSKNQPYWCTVFGTR